MPSDYAGLFDFSDGSEEDDPNLLRRRTSPMYDVSPDVGIDPNDPATAHYMARAREPLPSQGMYEHFLASKPDERDPDFKSNVGQKVLAGLFSAFGQKGAAEKLIHPGYKDAFEDWTTEAKFLPSRARAADVGRQRELESEKFGIIGQAKKRQAVETERTHKAAETQRAANAEAAKLKADKADALTAQREARAEAREQRAERQLQLSEERLKNTEEGTTRRIEEGETKNRRSTYAGKKKELEASLADAEDEIKDEISNDPRYKESFVVTKKGVVPKPEQKAFLYNLVQQRLAERRKKLNDRFFAESEAQGLTQPLDSEEQ